MPKIGTIGIVKAPEKVPGILLPSNLLPLAGLCVKKNDECRWALKGVYVESVDGGKAYRVCAGNTYRMVIVEGVTKDMEEYPTSQEFKDSENGKTATVIPALFFSEQMKGVTELNKKTRKPILKNVAVRMSEESITMEYTDTHKTVTSFSRKSDGIYPHIDRIIHRKRGKVSVILDGRQWCELANTVGKVCGFIEEDDESKTVQIDFYETGKAVVIRAMNEDLEQKITAIVMPQAGYDWGKNNVEGFRLELHPTENYWESEAIRLKEELDTLKASLKKGKQCRK